MVLISANASLPAGFGDDLPGFRGYTPAMLAHLNGLDARLAALLQKPQLMAIVNVTPNSFSDGTTDPAAAAGLARSAVAEGAAIVDLGAEASSFFRPGVAPVEAAEQLRRLLPVLHALRDLPALISVDTRSAAVAEAVIAAGAHLINDISAGTHDPAMFATAAALGVPIVLMHIAPSYPADPAQDDPDIFTTVRDYLVTRAAAAHAVGIPRHHIWLDPGIGFGKTPQDNWRLVDGAPALVAEGFPVVLGISRKRFLAARKIALPPELAPAGAHERDGASAYVTARAARAGVQIHRVHNVALCAKALRIG